MVVRDAAAEHMVVLQPDAFLTQLTRILERREKGTIYVTMKRCTHQLIHT